MFEIAELNFNGDNCTFNLIDNNEGVVLSNVNQYVPDGIQYTWEIPLQGQENDRFILFADGNLVIDNANQLIRIVAIVLLRKNDGTEYAMQRLYFNNEFRAVDN